MSDDYQKKQKYDFNKILSFSANKLNSWKKQKGKQKSPWRATSRSRSQPRHKWQSLEARREQSSWTFLNIKL